MLRRSNDHIAAQRDKLLQCGDGGRNQPSPCPRVAVKTRHGDGEKRFGKQRFERSPAMRRPRYYSSRLRFPNRYEVPRHRTGKIERAMTAVDLWDGEVGPLLGSTRRELFEAFSELIQLPLPHEVSCLAPSRFLIAKARHRCLPVHRRD